MGAALGEILVDPYGAYVQCFGRNVGSDAFVDIAAQDTDGILDDAEDTDGLVSEITDYPLGQETGILIGYGQNPLAGMFH